MKYKYHYTITRSGQLIDTAQDKNILTIVLHWLINFHGLTWYEKIKVKKERITTEEYKKRYC